MQGILLKGGIFLNLEQGKVLLILNKVHLFQRKQIEIALKQTTSRANASFEYINNIIKDWNERNLRTPAQVSQFLEERKQKNKKTKEINKQVKKENFEQREYSNLSFLYANKTSENNNE